MNQKEMRVAIVTDDGATQDEADFMLAVLAEAGLPMEFRVVARGRGLHQVKDIPADLLILDYGGAAAFNRGMLQWQLEAAGQYAEDHPGTLLIVWSSHTSTYYGEIYKEAPMLPNVLLRFDGSWHEEGIPALQRWFSPQASLVPDCEAEFQLFAERMRDALVTVSCAVLTEQTWSGSTLRLTFYDVTHQGEIGEAGYGMQVLLVPLPDGREKSA